MSLTKRTLIGGSWQFSLIAFRTIAQLLVIAILARLLTPGDFGVVAIANLVIGFIASFTQIGLGQALVQRKDLTQRHIRVGFTIAIVSAVLLATLLIIIAPLFSQFFRNQSLTPILRVFSLVFLLTNIGAVAEYLLIRDLAFDRIFRATVLTYTFGYALVGISMALMDYGAWSLVGATLATELVKSIALIRLRPHPKKPLLAKKEAQELIYFGGGITLANLATYLSNTGDYFVIGRWLGPSALGIYQQAFNVMLLPAKYLGDVLDQVLFASASRVQDKAQSLTDGYRQAIRIINLALMPISVIIIVLAPEIVLIMFGSQWTGAIVPLQILSIGIAFRTISRISGAFVHAKGAVYSSASRTYLYALAVIIGSVVGLRWGVVGVATAVTIAVFANYFLILELGLRLMAISWQEHLKDLFPGFLLGIIALIPAIVSANILREVISFNPLVIISSLFITFLVIVGFLWLFPQALGPGGTWLLNEARKALPLVSQFLKQHVARVSK